MLRRMRSLRTFKRLALAGAVWLSQLAPGHAQQTVSLELVLAVDASSSVNVAEHRLQMQGIARAFRSPEVMQLIEGSGGIAVILFQWASRANIRETTGWHILRTRNSILSFAEEVSRTRRVSVGSLTAIGSAIEAGLDLLDTNGITGVRGKIDVSGDGRNNSGTALEDARARAAARGVTINGLAIQTDVPDLAAYYRQHVTSGPDSFVIAAKDYADFARAMEVKLLRELSPAVSDVRENRQRRPRS
ncbi:MAG: DUF1194 domain-containing protein [Pseudomonadota bacterium]